jgi:hypothetical protein
MTGRAILRLSPIALLVFVAACGGGGTKTVTVTVTKTVAAPATWTRVYFVRNGKVAPVARTGNSAALLGTLPNGPNESERRAGFTTAPTNSRLFLAQEIYTLTQLSPAGPATFDGKRYSRADFEEQTPAILVENPLPFARVTSPIHATGTANTFEATFQYELKDAAGKILAKHFVTATSGNGVRGTFDVKVPFTVTRTQNGTLTVYEDSAATGKRINEYAIPLTLSP